MKESGSFWFTIVAVALLVAGIVGTILSWGWLHPQDPTTVSNSETLRNVGLLVGGVLAFVFAGWRAWVAERQANAARDQAEYAQLSFLNERYQKGADMLGSDVLSVRLGGIYALQRLAEEHPDQYHIQIIKLFCAFVRNPTSLNDEEEWARGQLRQDLQDVMRAIGSRSNAGSSLEQGDSSNLLYLRNAQLSGLQAQPANLANAWLTNANLSDARLNGADLTDARLHGANLSNAQLNRANLSGAELNGANLIGATFRAADLSRARLNGAIVNVGDQEGINLRAVTDFGGANLEGASLHKVDTNNLNLSGATIGRRTIITQRQLDRATADANNPPVIEEGTLDAETGEPLVWRGRPLDDES